MRTFYVYIMASQAGVLYVGLTSNIKNRVHQHKKHLIAGFTDKYDIDRLMYFETFSHVSAAIKREKQIKSWRRDKKANLIDTKNPTGPTWLRTGISEGRPLDGIAFVDGVLVDPSAALGMTVGCAILPGNC